MLVVQEVFVAARMRHRPLCIRKLSGNVQVEGMFLIWILCQLIFYFLFLTFSYLTSGRCGACSLIWTDLLFGGVSLPLRVERSLFSQLLDETDRISVSAHAKCSLLTTFLGNPPRNCNI